MKNTEHYTNVGETQVWLSNTEWFAIVEKVTKESRVLEYGSGGSTIALSGIVKEVVSIDHVEKYYKATKEQAGDNVSLHLVLPDSPPKSYWIASANAEEYASYIAEGSKHGEFDAVLIDGRARILCAKACATSGALKPNGYLFIHDWVRGRYRAKLRELLSHYTLEKEVNMEGRGLAIFRRRPSVYVATATWPIHVISRIGSPRRERVNKLMAEHFPTHPWKYIDGVNAQEPGFESKCVPLRDDAPPLLDGYRACLTAQATSLAEFLRGSAEMMLVLEDDFHMLCTHEDLDRVVEKLPPTFDWCKLDLLQHDSALKFVKELDPADVIVRAVRASYSAVAIFISRKGAAYLLANCIPQYTTWDCLTKYLATKAEVYNSTWRMIRQAKLGSMILTPEALVIRSERRAEKLAAKEAKMLAAANK